MKYGKICVLFVSFASLAACTTPSSNTQSGMQVQAPLVNSANVSSSTRVATRGNTVESYPAPNTPTPASMQNVSQAPPDNTAQQTTPLSTMQAQNQPSSSIQTPQTSARVASSGSGLSTNLSYSQTWDKVGKALPAAGYPVMEQDGSSGTYYVLDKSSTGGTIKRDTPIYQVRVQRSGQGASINVLNAQNQPAEPGVSSRILSALKNQIS